MSIKLTNPSTKDVDTAIVKSWKKRLLFLVCSYPDANDAAGEEDSMAGQVECCSCLRMTVTAALQRFSQCSCLTIWQCHANSN